MVLPIWSLGFLINFAFSSCRKIIISSSSNFQQEKRDNT